MIKLNAMRLINRATFLSLLLLTVLFSTAWAQSTPGDPVIISPRAGEAVQGRMEINGITETEGFQRAELEFRYVNDPNDTWFMLAESDQAVNPGRIAEWDTSAISDGNYDLRLTVCLQDGSCKNTVVKGIRVRNYSAVETPTPPDPGNATRIVVTEETPVPTRTPIPTRPAFEVNPAILTPSDLNSSLVRGGAVGIGFFLVFGIYWIIKRSLS